MSNPLSKRPTGQVSGWNNSSSEYTALAQTSFAAPYGLQLRQTITSSGAVTIPPGIPFVYVIAVGGGNSGASVGGVGGGVAWGWTIPQSTCIIGAGANPGGYTRYGYIIAVTNTSATNYWAIPGGGAGSTFNNGAIGATGGLGGNSNVLNSPAGNGGNGISGGGGGSASGAGVGTNTAGNGGSGLVGGGGGYALTNTGTNIGGNGGNGLGIDGTIYTGGTGSTVVGSNSTGGGGAGIAGNGSNAVGNVGGNGGLGGGGGGAGALGGTTGGTGGNGILYIFY